MSTLEVAAVDIKPGHRIALPKSKELVITGADSLKKLGETLNSNKLSPADWERMFAALNDTTDRVQVTVGQHVLLGQRVLWGKKKGKTGNAQLILSPPSGTEEDDTWGDIYAVGSYYHACGASGKRHFHKESYSTEGIDNPDKAFAFIRDKYESAISS